MLIAKMYINYRAIDNVYIHNTGKKVDGKYIYRIMEPGTRRPLTKTTIAHRRFDGYRKLLIKVLEVMEEEDIETIPTLPSMFDADDGWEDI